VQLLKKRPAGISAQFDTIYWNQGGGGKSCRNKRLAATVRQKELIQDILLKIEEADRMHEYFDYIQNPTRKNASEFITQALEYNLVIIAKKTTKYV
jgi:hypothetical protein